MQNLPPNGTILLFLLALEHRARKGWQESKGVLSLEQNLVYALAKAVQELLQHLHIVLSDCLCKLLHKYLLNKASYLKMKILEIQPNMNSCRLKYIV